MKPSPTYTGFMTYEVQGLYHGAWEIVMRLDDLPQALVLLQDLLVKGRAGGYRLEVTPGAHV